MSTAAFDDLGADQSPCAHQGTIVPAESHSPADPTVLAVPNLGPGRLANALLSIFADNLDGFERLRIDTEGRLRSITLDKGGDGASPEEQRLAATVDTLRSLEHGAELELKRALRRHPLGGWVRSTVGVGEKQGARLIAAIGDPYWNAAADRPRRGPAELWAYCGYHVLHPDQTNTGTRAGPVGVDSLASDHRTIDAQKESVAGEPSGTVDQGSSGTQTSPVGGVAPRRRRGQRANWNATAKMRAFLVAESCVKHRSSPYRAVYDNGRIKYADSGLPLGHQHARALRLVAKAVLKDLFLEAKRLHEQGEWQ